MSQLRQATAADVDVVVDLIYLAIKDIAYQLTGEKLEEKVLEQLKQFYLSQHNRFSYELIQVKVIDEQVVGMILCYNGSEADILYQPIVAHLQSKQCEVVIDKEADEHHYYIDALAVLAQHQGQGIAKELFIMAESFAKEKNYDYISLNVDYDNEKAKRLYINLGYNTLKTRYINNRPYLYMVKKL